MAERQPAQQRRDGVAFLARRGDRECSFDPPTQGKKEIAGNKKGGTLGFFQDMEGFGPRGRHSMWGVGWGRGGDG